MAAVGLQEQLLEKIGIKQPNPENITKFHPLDFIKSVQLHQVLTQQKLLGRLQYAYLTAKSEHAVLVFDEFTVEDLVLDWLGKTKGSIGNDAVSENDITKEFLPSFMFSRLLGTLIPFEGDAINAITKTIKAGTKALQGNFKIKFPKLSETEAHKLQYYFLVRLRGGLSPENLQSFASAKLNPGEPPKLISWPLFLASLPEIPEHLKTSGTFAAFNTACKKEGLFYTHYAPGSGPGPMMGGNHYQLTCDNFDNFIKCIDAVLEYYTVDLKRKASKKDIKPEDPSIDKAAVRRSPEQLAIDRLEYIALGEAFKDSLRKVQCASVVKIIALSSILKKANLVKVEHPEKRDEKYRDVFDKKWMQNAICMLAEISDFQDFYKNDKVSPPKRYQIILTLASCLNPKISREAEILEELNNLMLTIWLEAYLCMLGKVSSKAQFAELPLKEQLDILAIAEKEALVLEHQDAVKEIECLKKIVNDKQTALLLEKYKQELEKGWREGKPLVFTGVGQTTAVGVGVTEGPGTTGAVTEVITAARSTTPGKLF